MFQLGSLVVLCGLLIGTSRSLPDIQQILELGADSDWSEVKFRVLEALENVNADSLTALLSQMGVRLQIKDLKFPDLNISPSSSGDEITLTIPVDIDATLSLPFPAMTADVSASVEMTSTFAVQKNAQTGLSTLQMQKCSTNADKISVSLLGRQNSMVNTVLNTVTHSVRRNLSKAMDSHMCPLLHVLINSFDNGFISDLLTRIST